MKERLLSVLILMAFAIGLAVPIGPVVASGNPRTAFTGIEGANHCYDLTPDPRCTPGTLVTLPSGKTMLANTINIIDFQTSDPRFTGQIVVDFTFYPSTPQGTSGTGTFQFYPNMVDGYWEGMVALTLPSTGGVHSKFSATGYGEMEGLMLMGTNTNGLIEGTITRVGQP